MSDVMLENMRLENVRLSQRIEALEAAGKRLADAVDAVSADLIGPDGSRIYKKLRPALAAWRVAEKEACG